MSKADRKILVPREVFPDKPEEERKYRVLGENWEDKIITLIAIFNAVVDDKDYFVTLDQAPHTNRFDPALVRAAEFPANPKPLRERFYWATKALDGYKPGDTDKAEIRTEYKIGKGYWEQVLKLGGNGGAAKTLIRGEHKRALDGFGVNLDVYPKDIRKAARKVIDYKECKPLARIESQSKPVLYHPGGREDVLFEIKFDRGIGGTFDGHRSDIVEVEIEIKEMPPGINDDALLDEAEQVLYRSFNAVLAPVYEAKPAPLFTHLVAWREQDKQEFKKAFKTLPPCPWRPRTSA